MMSTQNKAKRLRALLKRLAGVYDPVLPGQDADDLIETLLWSYLLWECNTTKAEHAMRRLRSGVADFNELRVCLPEEIEAMLGERYPLRQERAARLRATLHDIFRREHAVTLAPIAQQGKREARKHLESLDGVPQYVAARTTLLGLGGHAFPLDGQIFSLLVQEQVVDPDDPFDRAAGALERLVKAADGAETHGLLQAWAENPAAAAPRSSGRAAKKKTAAKRPAGAGRHAKKS